VRAAGLMPALDVLRERSGELLQLGAAVFLQGDLVPRDGGGLGTHPVKTSAAD